MSSNILENMNFFISRNVPYTAKMKMHFLRNLPNICKGKNVYCPCCGTKMNHMEKLDDKHYPITAYNRKWRNIANPNDAYAICPVCDSAPRHRILAYYLDSSGVLEHLRDKDIIYFTEERGMRFFLDKRGIRHKCANLNKEADPLREADLYIDIQDMPFADNSVDAIFANHILEHVADYKKAICEVYRVIREGGVCSSAQFRWTRSYIQHMKIMRLRHRRPGSGNLGRRITRDCLELISRKFWSLLVFV